VALDEMKINVDGQNLYVWTAVDSETVEVLHMVVSFSRSSLDAFLFLKEVLKRYNGRPLMWADRSL
jgi:putative transposase